MATKNEAFIGYCIRGCGKPANAIKALDNGDLLATCGNPDCTKQQFYPAYCDPNNEVRGAAYDKNLTIKEIAKLMRLAIKKELPGAKVSVRMQGWNCIRVALVALPGINCEPYKPMQQWYQDNDLQGFQRPWKENYSPELAEVMAKLKEIHGRWNRDNSDSMTDYFDVNYYGSVAAPDGNSW